MTLKILGYTLYTGQFAELAAQKRAILINTLNPHSYAVAKNDAEFHAALLDSDYLVPDGVGIVLAARLQGERIRRMSGYRLFLSLMRIAERENLKVMFVGSTEETLLLIKKRLQADFPSVYSFFHSPPFATTFSPTENLAIVRTINEREPDILFVGMTAPKQEKWAFEQRNALNVRAIACIGAVFNFYAGNIRRPSMFWRRIGLEWLIRLVGEPRRLWRRTFVSMPIFLRDVIFSAIRNH